MRRRITSKAATVGLICCAAAAVAVAVPAISAEDDPAPPAPIITTGAVEGESTASTSPGEAVPTPSGFAVFRRAATASDAPPATVAELMAEHGVAPAQIRRPLVGEDIRLYAVPAANDELCLAAETLITDPPQASLSCAPAEVVREKGLTISLHCWGSDATGLVLAGLVPDGVRSARLTMAQTTEVARTSPKENAFLLRAPAGADYVYLDDKPYELGEAPPCG